MAKQLIDRTTLMSYLKKIVDKCKETYSHKKDTVKDVELIEEYIAENNNTIKTLKFTYGDDTVKEFENIGGGSGNANIDDTTVSTLRVYSSSKVESDFLKKADAKTTYVAIEDSHTHENLDILNSLDDEKLVKWNKARVIELTGDGTGVLTNDGTYKVLADFVNQINDNAPDSLKTTFSAKKIGEVVDNAKAELDAKKVDKIDGMGLSTNDYTTRDKARIEMLEFEGDGTSALFNDGQYYPLNNCGIDDETASGRTTFSSEKVNDRIKESIDLLVLPTQNDAPTMWQKTYLNVKSGDVLEMTTTTDFIISKTIVQAFKRVEGEKDVIRTVNKFTASEEVDFFYNTDSIEFTNENDGAVKIRDKFSIPMTFNSTTNLYESNTIRKSDYIELNGMTIETR